MADLLMVSQVRNDFAAGGTLFQERALCHEIPNDNERLKITVLLGARVVAALTQMLHQFILDCHPAFPRPSAYGAPRQSPP
jgi:hypothetical protein